MSGQINVFRGILRLVMCLVCIVNFANLMIGFTGPMEYVLVNLGVLISWPISEALFCIAEAISGSES